MAQYLMLNHLLIQQIDACLPQTQCGQCGYPGCLPYAQAIAQGTPINQCPPGGHRTIKKLAQLLQKEMMPLNPIHGEITERKIAYIREAECIGCTKCIQACPVDAIIGAAKKMHTVLTSACTGCDLCVEPCPVDCIDMLSTHQHPDTELEEIAQQNAQHWRSLFQRHNQRLAREQAQKKQPAIKIMLSPTQTNDSAEKQLQQAKSQYVMAVKRWKDAESALQRFQKQATQTPEDQNKIMQYQQQINQLKQLANAAKTELERLKNLGNSHGQKNN